MEFKIPDKIQKEVLETMLKDNYRSAFIYKFKAEYYKNCYTTKKVDGEKLGKSEIDQLKQDESKMLFGYKHAKAFIKYIESKER